MAHPDYVVAPDEAAHLPLHEPVYGLTEGLTAAADGQGGARRAGARCPPCRNGRMRRFLKQRGFAPFNAALAAAHAPVHESDLRRPRCRASGWPMTSFWPTSWR